MKENKLFNIVYKLLIIIFIFLLIYSLYHILIWKMDNNKNKKIKHSLESYIKVDKDEHYRINFNKLKEKNSDVVGYLRVNNTNIDYVVVKGKDNSYYLSHNFNKDKNIAGWIFMDYKNNLDNKNKNTIIYGHNTADESMFGTLKNTLEEEWYLNNENHKVLYIDEKGTHYYDVFSTYKIDNEDYYLQIDFKSSTDFNNYIDVIKNRSVYNYNVDINENDNILTLSSCANLGKKRVVLHAKELFN